MSKYTLFTLKSSSNFKNPTQSATVIINIIFYITDTTLNPLYPLKLLYCMCRGVISCDVMSCGVISHGVMSCGVIL